MRKYKAIDKLTCGKWAPVVFESLLPGDIICDTEFPEVVYRVLSHPKAIPDSDGSFRGNSGFEVEALESKPGVKEKAAKK